MAVRRHPALIRQVQAHQPLLPPVSSLPRPPRGASQSRSNTTQGPHWEPAALGLPFWTLEPLTNAIPASSRRTRVTYPRSTADALRSLGETEITIGWPRATRARTTRDDQGNSLFWAPGPLTTASTRLPPARHGAAAVMRGGGTSAERRRRRAAGSISLPNAFRYLLRASGRYRPADAGCHRPGWRAS